MRIQELVKGFRYLKSRNFLALLLDWTAFAGAMSFISPSTILPAFVTTLTTSNVAVGFIGSIFFLGFNLPQILVSSRVERLKHKKGHVLKLAVSERLPWLIMSILTILMLPSSPNLVLPIFFVLLCVSQFSSGASAPAWLDVVGKVIPGSSIGTYFGTANLLGSILSLAMSYVSYFYLGTLEYPASFAACFLSAFALMIASYLAFYTVKEPESEVQLEGINRREYIRGVYELLKRDSEFRKYLIASAMGSMSSMGAAFFAASAIRAAGLEREVGVLTSALMLGQVISNLVWIKLSSTRGHKYVLATGGLMNLVACVLAAFSTNLYGFFVVFLLNGASFTSFVVSGISIIYELSPEGRRPTYFGLSSLIRAPFSTLAPIIGGVIADLQGYTSVYAISSVMSFLYIITLLTVNTRAQNSH